MDNTTAATAANETKLQDKNSPKKERKTRVSRTDSPVMVGFTFAVGKESTQTENYPVSAENFSKDIAAVLHKHSQKLTFKFKGHTFIIPAVNSSNTNFERAAAIFKQLVTKVFPADKESTENLPANNEFIPVFRSIQHFAKWKNPNKAEISKAVKFWEQNRKAKVSLATEIVRKENKQMLAETKVITETVKAMRVETGKAITGAEKAYTVKFGRLLESK